MAESGMVFVIDDDASMCDLIRENLGRDGLVVHAYPSADTFAAVDIAALTDKVPCCILLDLEMPGVSGLDFLERHFSGTVPCPVIIVTAKGTVQSAVKSMKLGAMDILEKPFAPETLKALVRNALETCAARCTRRHEREAVRARLAMLSPREREMLEAIVHGRSTKMVADLLRISVRTVDHHRANLMEKMRAANVADLVRMAVEADYQTVERSSHSPDDGQ